MAFQKRASDQDWDETELHDVLMLEWWHPYSAIWVLAGFKYPYAENYPEDDFTPYLKEPGLQDVLDPSGVSKLSSEVSRTLLDKMRAEYERLHKFWLNAQEINSDQESHPPSYFIDWALKRRVTPTWLEWAINRGLYTPDSKVLVVEPTESDNDGKNAVAENAKRAAEIRHSKPGGSKDLREKICAVWAKGNFSSREVCAEQEYEALGFKTVKTARKALMNAPDPNPWPAKGK